MRFLFGLALGAVAGGVGVYVYERRQQASLIAAAAANAVATMQKAVTSPPGFGNWGYPARPRA